jgi:hypothetical protein
MPAQRSGEWPRPRSGRAGAAASTGPKASSYRLRRQLLQLRLRLAFPHEAVHDEPTDRYGTRQAMGGSVFVDDGQEFDRHPDSGRY